MLTNIIIISLSAYGFSTAIQMIRGTKLSFRPFNCHFCLSFYFGLICYPFFTDINIKSVILIVIYSFTTSCIVYFLKLIEDRLSYYHA